MKNKKILLINSMFVEFYVSGLCNRFVGLWSYFQNKPDTTSTEIHWLTNQSLWNKYFPNQKPPSNVTIIKANLKFFKFTSRLVYPFYFIYIFYKKRCTSAHITNSVVNMKYLLRLFNFLRIPYCLTFASNSLQMSSYNSEKRKKYWQSVLTKAKNIDILNPTNSLNSFPGKKFISPTSFPYIISIKKIPEEKFLNKDRQEIIVFCGSFVEQKNPQLAIQGVSEFLKTASGDFHNVKLIMIGKGELYNDLFKMAKKINQEFGKDVIIFEKENSLVEILSSAKIFLSLQDYDNYPSQSIMEAMLFCNSIISINNGDTKKLVDPQMKNLLMEEKSPILLAKGIEKILKNWELNYQNRNHVLKNFSVEIFGRYFLKIHDELSV